MIVGNYFFLNLFIGVVINTFNTEAAKADGSALLTDKQKEWIDMRLLVLRSSPIKKILPPKNLIRRLLFEIYNHRYFERGIQVCIILNTVVLMLKWYRQPVEVDLANDYLNYFFTLIFALEAAVRITGIGY